MKRWRPTPQSLNENVALEEAEVAYRQKVFLLCLDRLGFRGLICNPLFISSVKNLSAAESTVFGSRIPARLAAARSTRLGDGPEAVCSASCAVVATVLSIVSGDESVTIFLAEEREGTEIGWKADKGRVTRDGVVIVAGAFVDKSFAAERFRASS
jgi:hypothetical protein